MLLYILSLGPVAMLVEKGFIPTGSRTSQLVGTIYQPIEWAASAIPLLNRPLGSYLHLWAPTLYDSKGHEIRK